jgi:hypothetical protein
MHVSCKCRSVHCRNCPGAHCGRPRWCRAHGMGHHGLPHDIHGDNHHMGKTQRHTRSQVHAGGQFIHLYGLFRRLWSVAKYDAAVRVFIPNCNLLLTVRSIVSRVFQGIGSAGMWSIGLTMGYELVPRELYPIQGALYTGSGAIGSLTGPLIGGGTSQNGQWRWAFLFK